VLITARRFNYFLNKSQLLSKPIKREDAADLDGEIYFYGGDEFDLDHPGLIKMVNLLRERFELAMIAFHQKRAPALEQLVLVAVDG
jgi:hypothetical protein